MLRTQRRVYVISDLHIGGDYSSEPGQRGFRVATRMDALASFITEITAEEAVIELVIAGDFVDFLAEPNEDGTWRAFEADPVRASALMQRIIDRDRLVFDALAALLAAGHAMTILLGNHDIELGLPAVRETLMTALRPNSTSSLNFLYDGEAYRVGNVLIEHGNRYDGFNTVNHDQLRRMRSRQSRGLGSDPRDPVDAPVGSSLVAEVMNPVKAKYGFVDLLKPETGAVVPLLLALEPSVKAKIGKLARFAGRASLRKPRTPTTPSRLQDVARLKSDRRPIVPPLPPTVEALVTTGRTQDVSRVAQARGLLSLVATSKDALWKRLPALRDAVRVLQTDQTFDPAIEPADSPYLLAAQELARAPIDHVVMGHTHLARKIQLRGGGYYLNTGTWADLMRFPAAAIDPDASDADTLAALARFVDDIAANQLSAYVKFCPSCAVLDLGTNGRVERPELRFIDPS